MSIEERGETATELLSPHEMAEADRLTIASGIAGETLMRRAAEAVAEVTRAMAGAGRRVAVLAGSGNNGGDAYAAATLLRGGGFAVTLFRAGETTDLRGDALTMAYEWGDACRPLSDFRPEDFDLAIDGLFGAGLSRDVGGVERLAIERMNAGRRPVVAIDLPSGVSGDDGQVRGIAVSARRTVTFFRRKPGHLLLPGRALCGAVHVADIGISPDVLRAIDAKAFANEPSLFHERMLLSQEIHHKYDRGHAVVFSGGASQTGAARLSAMAALRGGAGLVTIFAPAAALLVNAAHLTAIMLRRCEDETELVGHLRDARLTTFVLGPGFGAPEKARAFAKAILEASRALVLDADGLTAHAEEPPSLFAAIAAKTESRVVLTPHDGEFKRLFPDLAEEPSKLEQARQAAARSSGVVVLKGSDTVIAAPDGRAAINGNAPANLATAGTGDVLSGLVAAQLANGVPAFEAACAAVWLHAKAASAFGPGLIAEDLPGLVPDALAALASR